jgi:hypothetical protein
MRASGPHAKSTKEHPMRPILASIASLALAATALAQSTAFTYQGELNAAGQPANGTFDMRFRIYAAPSGGGAYLPTTCVDNVAVVNGKFTASISAGSAFNAHADRYVEVDVRADTGLTCGNTSGFTTLAPRQAVSHAPLAMRANTASALAPGDGGANPTLTVSNAGAFSFSSGGTPDTPLVVLSSPVAFRIGEAMRIQNTNAGAPGQGYIAFGESGSARTGYVGDAGAGDSDIVLGADIGGVALSTPAGRVVNVTPGGNVGIGTATPAARLHVVAPVTGTTPGEGVLIQGTSSGSDNLSYLAFNRSNGTRAGYVGDGSSDNDVFLASDFGGVVLNTINGRVLTATASGNVGIGTTNPLAKLDVVGNAAVSGFLGIGTTSPSSKLTVLGNVQLGANAEFFAPGAQENLRIIRGEVAANGTIIRGTGFTVINDMTGLYLINFTTPFADTVTATVTPNISGGAANSYPTALLNTTSASHVRVFIRDVDANTFRNFPFHFIAIGPR